MRDDGCSRLKSSIRRAALVLAFAAMFRPAVAQEFVWVKTGVDVDAFESLGHAPAHSLVLDSSGNIVVHGAASIEKRDGTGSVLWLASLGGNMDIASVAVDASANVYAVGTFSGTVDFNPGNGIDSLTTAAGVLGDSFILKLDASGGFVWVKQLRAIPDAVNNAQVDAVSVALDAGGNIVTVGYFGYSISADFNPGTGESFLTSNQYDSFVVKLDPAGNFLWATTMASDYGQDVATGPAGRIIVAGVRSISPSLYKGELAEIDASGNGAWSMELPNFGGSSVEFASIASGGDGNIYLSGTFTGTLDFVVPGSPFPFPRIVSNGAADVFVAKIDGSHRLAWVRSAGGSATDQCSGIGIDTNGNVYVTGRFRSTADFDPGPGAFNLTAAGSSEDAFIWKLDHVGALVWAGRIGDVGADATRGVAVAASGDIFTHGTFAGNVDFDPGDGMHFESAGSASSGFLLKLRKSGAGSVPDGSHAPDTPLTVSKSGAQLSLQWSVTCSPDDVDYEVYEGTVGAHFDHQPILCSTGGLTHATIVPSGGSRYYLVVPKTNLREGSYGKQRLRDATGQTIFPARPVAASACIPQAWIGDCAP